MIGMIAIVILFVLLFEGQQTESQNEKLVKQNKDIMEMVKNFQRQ